MTLSLILTINAIGQNKCNCEVLIDYKYKKQIYLFDKPNGQIVDSIANDIENEDFLEVTITESDINYFKTIIKLSIAGTEKTGWISKQNYIGVYARNYSDVVLNLYTQPDKNSKIESTVNKWIPDFYQVNDCQDNWVKVKLNYIKTIYTGWLEKKMQCANSYSTCN